jgi:hypothetical protein
VFIKKGEPDQAARLFSFLMLGEQVAQHCALEQSKYTTHKGSRKFLLSQSSQENYHRILFDKAVLTLTPKGAKPNPANKPMLKYQNLLNDAIATGQYAETLLGQQVILEGLGEVVLENIDKGMSNRMFGFKKIRRIILKQEQAHHDFGLRKLNDWVGTDETRINALSAKTSDYLDLIHEILNNFHDVFEYFGYDSNVYYSEVKRKLPDWIKHQQ